MRSETKVTVPAKIEAEKVRKIAGLDGCSDSAKAAYKSLSAAYRAIAMDVIEAYKAGNHVRLTHAEIVSSNIARQLRNIITNG